MALWVRLWEDMPTDPKWRVVARRAGRPLPEVLSIFVFMLANAGAAAERGALENWNDEDVAAALDMEADNVAAIRDAMQGKTLDGDRLTGWERRQPKKEDSNAAERARLFRERQNAERNATERSETLRNAAFAPEEKRVDAEQTPSSVSKETSDGRDAPLEVVTPPDAELYRRGKTVLGKASGGMIAKLLKHHGGNIALARASIETASVKSDPAEYIGAILRNRERDPTQEELRARNEAW